MLFFGAGNLQHHRYFSSLFGFLEQHWGRSSSLFDRDPSYSSSAVRVSRFSFYSPSSLLTVGRFGKMTFRRWRAIILCKRTNYLASSWRAGLPLTSSGVRDVVHGISDWTFNRIQIWSRLTFTAIVFFGTKQKKPMFFCSMCSPIVFRACPTRTIVVCKNDKNMTLLVNSWSFSFARRGSVGLFNLIGSNYLSWRIAAVFTLVSNTKTTISIPFWENLQYLNLNIHLKN